MSNREKRRWVIVPIEVMLRELPSRLLLACGAAARGYHVIIGREARIIQHISRLPLGVVVEKSICFHREARVISFHEMGHQICNSDEESDFIYNSPENFASTRMNKSTLEATSAYFCWSEGQRSLLSQAYPEFQEKFVPTGTCRTDIWRKEFRSVFDDDVRSISERFGPYILFNSNFSYSVEAEKRDAMMSEVVNSPLVKDDDDRDSYVRMMKGNYENLDIYREILPKIVEWFPSHRLIIRPHPVENEDFWRRVVAGVPRAVVVREGVVTPWILGADVMVHHGCMTAIETTLLGRPAIFFGPAPDPAQDNSIGAQASLRTTTEAELRAAIAEAISGGFEEDRFRSTLEPYFASLEGRFSYERILDAIDRLDVVPQPPSQGIIARDIKSPTLLKKIERALKFKAAEPNSAAGKLKWPGVTVEQMSYLANKLVARSPNLKSVSVHNVHPDVFVIAAV